MRLRHNCAKGMLIPAERVERMMASFVGVGSEEGEIDYWSRGSCLAEIRVGFGLISAQDTRSIRDKEA